MKKIKNIVILFIMLSISFFTLGGFSNNNSKIIKINKDTKFYGNIETMTSDNIHNDYYNKITELSKQTDSIYAHVLDYYEDAIQKAIEREKWNRRFEEYPIATNIWTYMKTYFGWSDYVCAGIIGNMMTEAGGQTLNIQPNIISSSGNYYGVCQWSKGYSEVWYKDLLYQLEFLKDTIKYEIDTYGFIYKNNFNYNNFLNLTNEQEVAKAFAKCYERCGSASYTIRQKNASIAYNYFT